MIREEMGSLSPSKSAPDLVLREVVEKIVSERNYSGISNYGFVLVNFTHKIYIRKMTQ